MEDVTPEAVLGQHRHGGLGQIQRHPGAEDGDGLHRDGGFALLEVMGNGFAVPLKLTRNTGTQRLPRPVGLSDKPGIPVAAVAAAFKAQNAASPGVFITVAGMELSRTA